MPKDTPSEAPQTAKNATSKSASGPSTSISRRAWLGGAAGALAAGSLPARATADKPLDALVIGAGLSGLHAARLLEEGGMDVQTLEGRNRLGGRVYTLMGVPGKPEAAGELIGANYARMLDTARRLNLDLIGPENIGGSAPKYFRINGTDFLRDEWPNHPLNPMTGDNRAIPPDQMLFKLSHQNNPLSGQPLDAWLAPAFQKYDIPNSVYLREQLGFNEETIRLMNVTLHTDHMDNTSALHELRRYAVGEFNSNRANDKPDEPAWSQIKGGNSLMPAAMANSLKREVLLNKTVFAFEDDGSVVTVHCQDGTRYRAKNVVCSMPMSVLRRVKFAPRLPKMLESAVDEIDYGISMQVHYLIKRNFWEDDGLPASIWSDTAFERFAVLERGANKEVTSAVAFINGQEAYKYDFMDDAQVMAHVTRELVKARPSLAGAIEPVMVQSCHRDIHGAGDWVFWRPGQVTAYANHMREPHGNIHFCGEHTAIMERGMEGAFESGERAAIDVLLRS